MYQGQVGWGKSEPQFWSFWQSSISHSRVKSLTVSKLASVWFPPNGKQRIAYGVGPTHFRLKFWFPIISYIIIHNIGSKVDLFENPPEYWPGKAKFLNCSWKASPCSFSHDPNIWTSRKSVPQPFSKKRNSCWLSCGFNKILFVKKWSRMFFWLRT